MGKTLQKLHAFRQAVQETYEQDGLFHTLIGIACFIPNSLNQ